MKRKAMKRKAMKRKAKFVPFRLGVSHVPDYYRLRVRPIDGGPEVEIDALEVIRAAKLGFASGCVVKHALRAGKKPGNGLAQDAAKCAEYAQRWAAEQVKR